MRDFVAEHRPDLLEAAVAAVGDDPFARAGESTAYLQPAVYCASVASLGRLEHIDPAFYAGHSLGEFSALVAAGSLTAEDGLRLVVERGRLMREACEVSAEGGMLAVGASVEHVAPLAERFGLTVANDNSPGQVVLCGDGEAIGAARTEAKAQGLRAYRLPVRGAFHSPVMEPAVPHFRAALDEVEFREPRRPVISGVTAAEFEDFRAQLAQAITSRVRWREVLLALRERGVDRYVEAGPGQALTKLVRRTLEGVEAQAAEELETANA